MRRGDEAVRRVKSWIERLRHRRAKARPRVRHRPDGTIVPAVRARPARPAPSSPAAMITAPFRGVANAVGERWRDAAREAKLAMREKETEIRADYERRVQHDPHLHGEQHKRPKDG